MMLVGSRGKLSDFLQHQEGAALEYLGTVDADVLLAENEDVLIAEVMSRYLPEPVAVRWSDASRSEIVEATKEVADNFEGRARKVAASRLEVRFPIDGSPQLFEFESSTMYMGVEQEGRLDSNHLVLVMIEQQLTAALVERRVADFRNFFNRMEDWLNRELQHHSESLNRRLRDRLLSRRARILNDRSLQASLHIPVREKSSRPPVVRRRERRFLSSGGANRHPSFRSTCSTRRTTGTSCAR